MADNNVLVHPDAVQSVVITVTETVEKNEPYYQENLHGFIMDDADSGDEVVMDVSARTWQVNVGELSVAKGDKIYIDTATKALSTDNTDRLFGYVRTAKDDDNICDILVAVQS